MTNEQQPKPLRLADLIDANLAGAGDAEISAELRRLHAETINQQDWFVEWKKCEQQVMGLSRLHAEQIGDIVALKEQRDELLEALHLALEYWAHREQRYKNRSPVWVQKSRAAIAKATQGVK